MPKNVIAFMICVFLLSVGIFIYVSEHVGEPTTPQLKAEVPQDVAHQEIRYQNRTMDIATYVSTHISELSPVQETLGGTFYVTDVKTSNGKGIVEYEDGHSHYTADFVYSVSEDNGYTITKFRVRE
jgi:hypothetical protein